MLLYFMLFSSDAERSGSQIKGMLLYFLLFSSDAERSGSQIKGMLLYFLLFSSDAERSGSQIKGMLLYFLQGTVRCVTMDKDGLGEPGSASVPANTRI